MAYVPYDSTHPDAASNGTNVLTEIRQNFAALRDADFFGGEGGWAYTYTSGTANEPTTMVWSKGTERLKIIAVWGTTGGENGNITALNTYYSSNSGGAYDLIEARTPFYDASGNFTSGEHTLMLPILQGLPGRVKQQFETVNTSLTAKAATTTTISAGTGLSGGGSLAANRTLSIDTTWGDARWLPKAGGTVAGATTFSGAVTLSANLAVKSATHTEVTPGALAIDWTASQRQLKTLTANSTFTFSANPSGPANLTLKVRNTHGSTAITLTWPASVKWPNGTAPAAHAAGKTALYFFYWDGVTYWGSALQGYANV